MNAILDVDYRTQNTAVAACVLFDSETSSIIHSEFTVDVEHVLDYEPGSFYKRELPCLLKAIDEIKTPLKTIYIDGYVWLSEDRAPGLGAHLYEAIAKQTPIIGIAKQAFRKTTPSVEVFRGTSKRPLFVTAAGIKVEVAAKRVREMHGPNRLPTLVKRVDRLCRIR